MMRAWGRLVAWGGLAVLIAGLGFFVWVFGLTHFLGASAEPDAAARMRTAFAVYFQVVWWKGLLPAVVGAVAIWPVLDRGFSLATRARAARALGVVLAASLSSVVAASGLMPRAMFGLPAASYRGTLHFAQSALELTVAVCAALALASLIVRRFAAPSEGEGESARRPAALGSPSIQR